MVPINPLTAYSYNLLTKQNSQIALLLLCSAHHHPHHFSH